jgi:phosphoglycerate dehydrogenase-like enzyme
MIKIHLLHEPEAEHLEVLKENLTAPVTLSCGEHLPQDVQILVAGRPNPEHLQNHPALRTLIIPFAGVPENTRKLMLQYPQIAVHNLHHNASATAETALALLLGAAKFLVPYDRALRQGDWRPRYQPSRSILLDGKQALVLGFGEIGRRVALGCQGLGMQVSAIRRRPATQAQRVAGVQSYRPERLNELLGSTHVLVITLPDTPQTHGLIDKSALKTMPPGGILVNVGRGVVVEQGALYQALKSQHLAAAGVDVWYNYPDSEEARQHTPPGDFAFHELDNLVMSPHRAGSARQIEVLRMRHLAELLNAAGNGAPLPNRVDLEAGY